MITRVKKIGNSYWVLIPNGIVKSKELKDKTSFDIHENIWDDVFRKPHKE